MGCFDMRPSFVGLVFDPAVVGPLASVTAPPYDVIGEAAERGFNVFKMKVGSGDHGLARKTST